MNDSSAQTSAGIRYLARNAFEMGKAHLRRVVKQTEVARTAIRPGLRSARYLIISVVRNDADRLSYFLQYYRNLGFEHFVFIDNASNDDTSNLLMQQSDVSIFRARGQYGKARYGLDWVNNVLSNFAKDKWVLHVDSDEFLVYPHCDVAPIQMLADHLFANQRSSLQCILIDMYSDRRSVENFCPAGADPLRVCSLYDATGYLRYYDRLSNTNWIKGGVRGRIYFDGETQWPALNKTPFVLWRPHYAFLKSTHELWPPQLNGGHRPGHVTGVLMHFKFLQAFSRKVMEYSSDVQHTAEWRSYLDKLNMEEPSFPASMTRKCNGWKSFLDDGLMTGEGWINTI